MATILTLDDEQGYIDIIFTPSSSPHSCSSTSNTLPDPSTSIDFEFQKLFTPNQEQPTLSPADDLFYMGKLLPHYDIPPCQEIHSRLPHEQLELVEEQLYYSITFETTNDDYGGADGSPEDQLAPPCLDSIDFCFECSTSAQLNPTINNPSKKTETWMNKVWLILGDKMKASRVYLKSVLLNSAAACLGKSCYKKSTLNRGARNSHEESTAVIKKKTFSVPKVATVMNSAMSEGSGAVIRRRPLTLSSLTMPPSSASSSCSSSSSSGAYSYSFRTSSVGEVPFPIDDDDDDDSDQDVSIDAAIAYCNKSAQDFVFEFGQRF